MHSSLVRWFKSRDRGLWLALALALLAAWPFLLRAGLPHGTDAELHVYRTAEFGYLLRAADLFPRWGSDLYYGYGYPIFSYYGPLPYYAANLLMLLNPAWAVWGVRAVFALSFLLLGGGMFAWGRDLSGRSAGGLIAAAAALFAPYIQLINPHWRGDLPEALALGLLPLSLWHLRRWLNGERRALLWATLLSAALILAHNLTALTGFGLLAGMVIWRWLTPGGPLKLEQEDRESEATIEPHPLLPLPLILAVGLTAYFWLPVALERDAVQLGNLLDAALFDYRTHFVPLLELLGAFRPLDLSAMNPPIRFALGIASWTLAGAGMASMSWRGRDNRRTWEGLYWLIAALALVLLMTPLSEAVWRAVPQMAFLQFPWRLLGPAAIVLGGLSSHAAGWLDRLPERWRGAGLALLTGLPLIAALPRWAPMTFPANFGPTDRAGIAAFEADGIGLGTTATGDFMPAAVRALPPRRADLVEGLIAGGPDRVDRAALPEGVRVHALETRATRFTFRVEAPDASTLPLLVFDWPGWRARVDGTDTPIRASDPHGLIAVDVPAGMHTVEVWLGTTPPRTAGVAISIFSTAGFTALIALFAIRRVGAQHAAPLPPTTIPIARTNVILIGGVAGLIALLGWTGLLQPRSPAFAPRPAAILRHQYLEHGIDFTGYTLDATSVRPGDTLTLTLYWQPREPVPVDVRGFVHLTPADAPAVIIAQADKLHPAETPTTRWPLAKYVRDTYTLAIPADAPPGPYVLRVGLWREADGTRLLLLEPDGTILGDAVVLAETVTVLTP